MRPIAFLALIPFTAAAQSRPLPHPVVPPASYTHAVAQETRTADGRPGPNYWQQWTRYQLRATLDPATRMLVGEGTIVHYNRSPDPLPVVFLHLYQNLHEEGVIRNGFEEVTGGITLEQVTAAGRTLTEGPLNQGPAWAQQGTLMAIRPPAPVAAGDSLVLTFRWHFTVPQSGSGRMGWSDDPADADDEPDLFYVGYWFPKVAVYDDVDGWRTDPYLGNAEFYDGFGSYDVTVTAPAGWLVMGTGRLMTPDALAPAVRERLARAERSDDVVHVLTPEDFGPGRTTAARDGLVTWRFVADTVRDAAFSATTRSRWDAARINVGDRDGDGRGDHARADAIWRESAPLWARAWRYTQHSIDFLSRWTGLPYPWPHMTAVEGAGIIGGGMEFPMMTLIGDYTQRGDSALYNVIAHELAHMWIPMIVGSDENRHAWMDEGSTSFNENQARKEFYPGPDHDDGDRRGYLQVARAGLEGEMMRWSDYHYPGPAYGVASYSKPATLLVALRALMGEDAFTRTWQGYINAWRYRHPKPWDFFAAFDAGAGQDLGWFWSQWYYDTWTLDQAITGVERTENGIRVTVEDRGRATMPVRLLLTFDDGSTRHAEIPVTSFLAGVRTVSAVVPGTRLPLRVEIDPDNGFPDVDRTNNRWVRP